MGLMCKYWNDAEGGFSQMDYSWSLLCTWASRGIKDKKDTLPMDSLTPSQMRKNGVPVRKQAKYCEGGTKAGGLVKWGRWHTPAVGQSGWVPFGRHINKLGNFGVRREALSLQKSWSFISHLYWHHNSVLFGEQLVVSLAGVWYMFRELGVSWAEAGMVPEGFPVSCRRVCTLIFRGGIFEGLSRALRPLHMCFINWNPAAWNSVNSFSIAGADSSGEIVTVI